jgi:hypothetical protein
MKIKVVVKEEKEVEITLPAFFKSSCQYYKIYSEKHCVSVCELDGNYTIMQAHAELAIHGEHKKSNEKEFNSAYKRVEKKLKFLNIIF